MLTPAGLPSLDTLLADTSDDAVPSDPLRFVGNPNSERVVRTGFAHADVSLTNVVQPRLRPASARLPTNVDERRRILLEHASPELGACPTAAAASSSSSPPVRSHIDMTDSGSDSDYDSAGRRRSPPRGHSAADAFAHAASAAAASAHRYHSRTPPIPITPPRGFSPPSGSRPLDPTEQSPDSPTDVYVRSLISRVPPARRRGDSSAPAVAAAASAESSSRPMTVDSEDEDENEQVNRALEESFNEQYLPSSSSGAAASSSSAPAAAAALGPLNPNASWDEKTEIPDADAPVQWDDVIGVTKEKQQSLSCAVGMCSNVPLNGPQMHRLCTHYMCTPCLASARSVAIRREPMTCPLCRYPLADLEASELRNVNLAELKARCIYHAYGCKAELTLANGGKHERAHRLKCEFRPKPCSYCSELIPSNGMSVHQADCPKRPRQCDVCNKKIPVDDFNRHRTSSFGVDFCQSMQFCPNRCFAKGCGVQPTAEVAAALRGMTDTQLKQAGALEKVLAGFAKPTVKTAYDKTPTGAAAKATAAASSAKTAQPTSAVTEEGDSTVSVEMPPPRIAIVKDASLEKHLAKVCPCREVDCTYPGCTDSLAHTHAPTGVTGSAAATVSNPKKRKLLSHELQSHLSPDNKKAMQMHLQGLAERVRELQDRHAASFLAPKVIGSMKVSFPTFLLEDDRHLYPTSHSQLHSEIRPVSTAPIVDLIDTYSGPDIRALVTIPGHQKFDGKVSVTISIHRPISNNAPAHDEVIEHRQFSCTIQSSGHLYLWRVIDLKGALGRIQNPRGRIQLEIEFLV